MSAVFSHGRLRLYLLKLLSDGPKHGYELIRLLEHQFLGLYAPSAGTIYPRLQRMETAGLVTHVASGGRKVYQITDAGRAELTDRAVELAALLNEVNTSVADLTTLAAQETARANEQRRASRGSVRSPWAPPGPEPAAGAELERRTAQLVTEVRRAARTDLATARAALAVLDAALDQVRRLVR